MANVENIPPLASGSRSKPGLVAASSSKNILGSSERKRLQTLQPSGKNKNLLVGADGMLRMSGGKKKDSIKIFEDPPSSSTPERKSSKETVSVQAEAATKEGGSQVEEADTAQARAEDFMYGEEHPPEYWRELAERTREALEASLLENEELHTSLSLVEEEREALVRERDELRDMAKQAEELAKIVKGLVTDDDDQDDDAEESDEGEEEDSEEETV